MKDQDLFELALKKAGYSYGQTEMTIAEQIKDCFIDYVLAGYWRNISAEDIVEFSLQEMALYLIK